MGILPYFMAAEKLQLFKCSLSSKSCDLVQKIAQM